MFVPVLKLCLWQSVGVPRRFYFATLISPAVATKIQSKHGVTIDEVREALDNYDQAKWDHSEEFGLWLLVSAALAAVAVSSWLSIRHGDRSVSR